MCIYDTKVIHAAYTAVVYKGWSNQKSEFDFAINTKRLRTFQCLNMYLKRWFMLFIYEKQNRSNEHSADLVVVA